jgi:hypothetical protein
MGIPALRQYIDATMHLCVNRQWGPNLQRLQYPVSISRAFLQFAAHCLRTRTDLLRQQAIRVKKEENKHGSYCIVLPIR